MNEQAKEVLAQLMQRALDGVDAAVELSQQQVPEIIHQLLTWKFVESAIWFLIGILFIGVSVALFKKLRRVRSDALTARENDEKWTWYSDLKSLSSESYILQKGAVFWIPPMFAFIGVLVSSCNLVWLKIWLAPKLYLLEYGASLVK